MHHGKPVPLNSPPPHCGTSRRWVLSGFVSGIFCVIGPLIGCSDSGIGSAEEVRVAAASDLKFAFDELAVAFESHHPEIDVKPTYGASGTFFAQLSNGAPYDLYLSADIGYPERLIEAGLADPDSLFLYAVGRLVVWVPESSPIDLDALGMQAVTSPEAKRVAIANPEHAPYGRAAVAALRSLGVYDAVAPKLVLGENIAQTAQFIDTGAADVGLIASSLALAPELRDRGRSWPVPAEAHPPLRQGGVIMNDAADREATRQLRDFLTGAEGRAILERYGFEGDED